MSSDLNPRTPELYRHEAGVLRHLPRVPYRPDLIDVFDDGEWVAIALEAIDGSYPDLSRREDLDAVRTALAAQATELERTRLPLQSLAELTAIWLRSWSTGESYECMPDWLQGRHTEFAARVADVPGRLPPDQLVHWDARDDNLLIRPDGSAVIFDWGMSRLGPRWADLLLLALRRADQREFDDEVDDIEGLVGSGPAPDLVDDFLVLFGVRLAYLAKHRPEAGIPAITGFRTRQSARLLEGARRRLGVT